MIWVEFAMTGLLAGFLAGYLGIGGGLVLVPILSWIFTRDPATADTSVQMAVATSLARRSEDRVRSAGEMREALIRFAR